SRRLPLMASPAPEPHRLLRAVDPHPFVPSDPALLDERCEEVFAIQTAGLAKRLEHTGVRRVTLGLSGGLDSTLALLVVDRTFDLIGLPREGILVVTMPGFGTTARTLLSARELAKVSGVPKTLVRQLVGWGAAHRASEAERTVLQAILDTPVSPELLPPGADGAIAQRTEELLGPYEAHDFFLFCLLRLGAGPRKTLFLARHAFAGRHGEAALRGWLRVVVTR